jgi:hypothetical protein
MELRATTPVDRGGVGDALSVCELPGRELLLQEHNAQESCDISTLALGAGSTGYVWKPSAGAYLFILRAALRCFVCTAA